MALAVFLFGQLVEPSDRMQIQYARLGSCCHKGFAAIFRAAEVAVPEQ
jgi:hypothetical protein